MNVRVFQEAKLIVYGKSFIEGDKHITKFDRVLWGNCLKINDKVLLTHIVQKDHYYGDHQIFFYRDNRMEDEIENWSVYDGEIPAWDDKTIVEFINYLKCKSQSSK